MFEYIQKNSDLKNGLFLLLFVAGCICLPACSKKQEAPFSITNAYGTFKGTVTETIVFTTGQYTSSPYLMTVNLSAGAASNEIIILFERYTAKAVVTGRKFTITDTTYSDGQVISGFGEFSSDKKMTVQYIRRVPIPGLGTLSNNYKGTLEK
jgi:hypothetical protein